MTFKLNNGIQVGANVAIDSAALLQQIESTPSVRPTLLLDFAKSKTVDARATFARASSALVVGQDGIIRFVGNNQPRIEYVANGSGVCEGLLIEPASSSQLGASQQFWYSTLWNSAGNNASVYPNVALAPDGTYTAAKLVDTIDATATAHAVIYSGSGGTGIGSNQSLNYSVFVKAGETSNVAVYPINGSNGSAFNLSTQTVISNDTGCVGSIKPYANGWFRCSVSITSNSTVTVATPRVYLCRPSTYYTGTGNNGLYIWGAHFENRSDPTSHIPSVETFTSRSSNGTYQDNNDGLLKIASSNIARYNYNRITKTNTTLLLEPAATNLLANSSYFIGGTFATPTNNNAVAPDGTTTACLITEDTTTNRHYIAPYSVSITANTINTGSVYLKAGTRTRAYVTVGMTGSPYTRGGMIVDLVAGTYSLFNIAATPLITQGFLEYVNNGWYRASIAVLTTTTDTTMYMEIGGADNSNNVSYLGTSSTFYAWGVQFEAGTGASSYIPTSGATATRAADVFSTAAGSRAGETMTMPISSVNLKPYEGTIAVEGRFEADTAPNQYIMGLGDTTVNSLVSFRMQSDSLSFLVYNSGSSQGFFSKSFYSIGNNAFKAAAAYSNTAFTGSFDGEAVQTAGPGIGIPPYGIITVGGGYGSGPRRLYIKNMAYYPKALSNSELISITSS